MDRPDEARAHPGAVPALTAMAAAVGTVAVITGRPRRTRCAWAACRPCPASSCSAIMAGSAGRTASCTAPASPPAVEAARVALPGLLAEAGAPDGTWIEDKTHALAVHTRRAADPDAALRPAPRSARRAGRRLGLAAEPGRFVIELRPPGVDKGTALTGLVRERAARSVLFCGDDLGDLPAFAAVRALRADGVPGCAVASASAESPQVAATADLVVDGPQGVVALLAALAAELGRAGRSVP